MKLTGKALLVGLMTGSAGVSAAELSLQVEIPALQVAEYHRPYVAVWIENTRGRHQVDLALWYDHDMRDDEGTKWLKDLRLWWRRSGRQLEFPVDGFTGATRPVGIHQVSWDSTSAGLDDLAAGEYRLVVEAAREVGGRELVKLPFQWPASSRQETAQQGSNELGRVELVVNP